MKYIVVGDVVRFGVGQALKLSAAQIDVRRHVLEVTDGDKGEVTASGPVEFKRGEEIGLKDKFEDLPRSLSDVLEPAVKAKKASPTKVEAGKKADQSGAADLDPLETALETAEGALAAAVEKHGLFGIDADTYTGEQKALVADELAAYAAAKAAYDAAIED